MVRFAATNFQLIEQWLDSNASTNECNSHTQTPGWQWQTSPDKANGNRESTICHTMVNEVPWLGGDSINYLQFEVVLEDLHTLRVWNYIYMYLYSVFADSQSVPELDGVVTSSRHNLPVVSGKCNAQHILCVTHKSTSGRSTVCAYTCVQYEWRIVMRWKDISQL